MYLKPQLAYAIIFITLFSSSAFSEPTYIKAVDIGSIRNINNEYLPIEPLIAASQVKITRNSQLVTKDIRTLTNDEKRAILGDSRVVIQLAKVISSEELSYMTGKVAEEKGSYIAFMDFSNFFIDDIVENSKVIGRARVGVGLRLIARISTKKRNIDLGSIFKIGFAASKGEIFGELEVRAIGITSNEIISLLPGSLPNLDESSIQRALESMAAIKSKIYDKNTNIQPRIMAVALNPESQVETSGFIQDR